MLKTLGAALILLSSCTVGFGFAGDVRRQTAQLSALISALENLHGEISVRRTPLAEALLMLSDGENREVGQFFHLCADHLADSCRTSPYLAIRSALDGAKGLMFSQQTRLTLLSFGMSLGKFDAQAQLAAVSHAASRLERELTELQRLAPARSKSYRTIGLCTGLALAVIFL